LGACGREAPALDPPTATLDGRRLERAKRACADGNETYCALACEAGHVASCTRMARGLFRGDQSARIERLDAACRTGSTSACVKAGAAYEHGDGVEMSDKE